ncbi:MAG: alkaline phosphatase family protein [Alphaproteobacteria bacterium]|nr:alkaline phosphatase family protein [Alphaproteobacteria bacterium]
MISRKTLLGLGLAFSLATSLTPASAASVKHVLLLSVDGLHEQDLSLFAKANPDSAFAKLMAHGVHFSNASTAKPSDSFPGLLAMVTGGSPKSTGVYYDDSYDRALSEPGSDCSKKGTEVVYDESIDKKTEAMDGGGGLDEAKLPRDGANGCKPVYPHSFLRVNTIFEVAKAAGLKTAWSDKHLAYDLVNGPSGKGVDDLYTQEINSSDDITAKAANTAAYDDTKVAAIINQIDGKSSDGKDGAGVPAIFGMNFQAVSVGQKTGGYADGNATSKPDLAEALKHTDASVGKMLAELAAKGLDKETLVILSAKHGQSPIDPAQWQITDKKIIPDAINGVAKDLAAQVTMDSVALVWLSDQSRTADAIKALEAVKDKAKIDQILGPDKIKDMFGDASKDSRVPDIVVMPKNGVIYTKPTGKKTGEHGGFGPDDTHVPLVVSNPALAASENKDAVTTLQVAPTILTALGLDPNALQAVKAEGTKALPGVDVK